MLPRLGLQLIIESDRSHKKKKRVRATCFEVIIISRAALKIRFETVFAPKKKRLILIETEPCSITFHPSEMRAALTRCYVSEYRQIF